MLFTNLLKCLTNKNSAFILVLFFIIGWSRQASAGTAFTYQGQLKNNSTAVTDTCNMDFSLYDAATAGNQIGSTVSKTNLSVDKGLFTTQLDFLVSAFDGSDRWLEIAVKCGSDSDFTTLAPRQPLTPIPYAIHALTVEEIDSSEITDGTIANADISNSAGIAHSKLADLNSGNILVGNGSNKATSVAMSGDVAISNTGAIDIQSGTIGLAELANICAANEVIKRKSDNSGWECAADDATGGGSYTTYTNSTGTGEITAICGSGSAVMGGCISSGLDVAVNQTYPADVNGVIEGSDTPDRWTCYFADTVNQKDGGGTAYVTCQ